MSEEVDALGADPTRMWDVEIAGRTSDGEVSGGT